MDVVDKDTCYSDFWLDGTSIDDYINHDKETTTEGKLFTMDLILLASYRKVISNFVSIATNPSIPVKYLPAGSTGATDGKTVFLSASVRKKSDFDWCVGLALHESMHIVKTDFNIFRSIWNKIPSELYKKGKEKRVTKEEVAHFCKMMFNVVEDRYIDAYAFKTCPGYRGYYKALYDKLWNSKAISATLKSKGYRLNNLESYEYRIIYLTNPATDLDALPELRKINALFDISTILREKTTSDRMTLSFKIVEMILDAIDKKKKEANNGGGANSTIKQIKNVLSGNSNEPSNEPDGNKDDPSATQISKSGEHSENKEEKTGEPSSEKEKLAESESESIEDVLGGMPTQAEKIEDGKTTEDDPRGDLSEFTPSQRDKIQKHFEQTKEMLMNDFDSVKETLTAERAKILEIVEQSGIHISHAHFSPENSEGVIRKVDCIVVKNLTKSLLFSGKEIFPLSTHEESPGIALGGIEPNKENLEAIMKGIAMGKRLGRKLQIRNETNIIKYIRRSSGKLEKRIIAEFGAGVENLFYKIQMDQFNTAKLHISVDASGSMDCSTKWLPTMTLLAALCQACSMIQNLHVSVSLRTTHDMDKASLPYIVIIYDSEVDKPSKIRQIFPFLKAGGATPEGLAFEAIMTDCVINKRSNGEDHYFVNISDGEPCYCFYDRGGGKGFSYGGEEAVKHTKRQVNIMRSHGIKILSYFIESDYKSVNAFGGFLGMATQTTEKQFRSMYGKDASMIDVTQVGQIAKTMNGLFLKKV